MVNSPILPPAQRLFAAGRVSSGSKPVLVNVVSMWGDEKADKRPWK
jgi:hypothetical protein